MPRKKKQIAVTLDRVCTFRHEGKDYRRGDVLDIDEEMAQMYLEQGYFVLADAPEEPQEEQAQEEQAQEEPQEPQEDND